MKQFWLPLQGLGYQLPRGRSLLFWRTFTPSWEADVVCSYIHTHTELLHGLYIFVSSEVSLVGSTMSGIEMCVQVSSAVGRES
jgi:hypothetical protein